MDPLAPPNCCFECQHPFTEHGPDGGCARFVHDATKMLVRCGCTDPYALAQAEHERRMVADSQHDPSSCVCCCLDCDDLNETLP